MTEHPDSMASTSKPKQGDRIVHCLGGVWANFRVGGKVPRYHESREAALRQARRLLEEQGSGSLFVMEEAQETGVYRLLRMREVRG